MLHITFHWAFFKLTVSQKWLQNLNIFQRGRSVLFYYQDFSSPLFLGLYFLCSTQKLHELRDIPESKHKYIRVNHIHFQAWILAQFYEDHKRCFFYNDLCPHHLCLSMILENIFRQESHSTLQTRMLGWKNYLLQIIILDHSGDLFNQMLLGPAL